MSIFGPILLCYLALALQATVVPYISIGGIRPDLPLVAVTLIGLGRGGTAGVVAGFLVGLAQDLTNPGFLGLNALAKCLLGYTAGSFRARFDAGTAWTYGALVAVATVAHDLVYLTIYTRLVLSEMFLALATRTLPTALYTAVAGALVAFATGALSGRGSHRLGRSQLARR